MNNEKLLLDSMLRLRIQLHDTYFSLIACGIIGKHTQELARAIRDIDSILLRCGVPCFDPLEEPDKQEGLN
jgi:hypothetical protein